MRAVFSSAIAALVAAIAPLPAFAQQQAAVCNQIRVELANLNQSGGGNAGASREAQRLRGELGRVRLAIQQNDCNRGGFLFFNSAPAVCAPLKAQAGQIEGRLRQLDGGGGGPNAQRRAQLIGALERYGCLGQQPPQRGVIYANPNSPSLFDQLFGGRPDNVVEDRPQTPLDPDLQEELEKKARLGGRTAVCVRTCDGFFFPVNYEGLTARDEHESVCQALCPAAETQVFYMRLGADISTAATRGGEPYTSLPAAMKYRESRVEDCSCKAQWQTWAQLAKGMEDIVEARKGDVVVTPEQAAAMSRIKAQTTPPSKKNAKQKVVAAEPEPTALPDSALPTGGTASAGIGPQMRNDVAQSNAQGTLQEVVGADGVKRQVRVVAPNPTAQNPVGQNPVGQEPQPALRGAKRP